MLVAYTDGAAAQAGGTAAVESLAAMSVAVSNDAFTASNVNLRFALRGTVQSSGTSSDASSATLGALRSVGDGSYDNVHGIRDQVGADLVSLLVASGGPYCGIAYYPAGAASGFSVVAQSCAVGNLSFPHELGHNLGASHDRYVEPSSYYPNGYGYVNKSDAWRTIMAYNNDCADSGFTCTRIARFSNPAVSYAGAPTGIPAGQPNAADNRTAIDAGAAAVAAYRPTQPREFPLTVTRSGLGAGTVTSSPGGIDCGSTCSASYADGTAVTLTAAPESGSAFTGWSGNCTGTSPTCALSMNAAKSTSASFSTIGTRYEQTEAGLDGWSLSARIPVASSGSARRPVTR